MKKSCLAILFIICCSATLPAQRKAVTKNKLTVPGVDIPVVGIIKGLSDSALLDVVQRQTFRYFWHFGHPVSGLARERSNTIRGEYFWDYADEAYVSPNLSTNVYGTETC